MRITDEQAVMLAALERSHGKVKKVDPEEPLAELLLSQCLTDTIAYGCSNCLCAFTIEPDGEMSMWALVPLVD